MADSTFGIPLQNLQELPAYIEFEKTEAIPLKRIFPAATDDALDLLSKFFIYNPEARITADEVSVIIRFHTAVHVVRSLFTPITPSRHFVIGISRQHLNPLLLKSSHYPGIFIAAYTRRDYCVARHMNSRMMKAAT